MVTTISLKKNKRKQGQVLLGLILLFLFISSTIVFGITRAVYYQLRSVLDFGASRSSYYLAEALAEDVVYRLKAGYSIPSNTTLAISGNTATANLTATASGQELIATANWGGLYRSVRLELSNSSGVSFFYGVQAGNGGVVLNNSSLINGNLYSNGSVVGSNNIIRGDVISAGPTGLINGIHATSSAYAHTITNSTVDKDAYYQSFAGATSSVQVSGATCSGANTHCYPGSADQATSSMPIPDSKIASWESDAAAGGSVTCVSGVYEVSSDRTLGPKKIPCDLQIDHNTTLTLGGPLWVDGNVVIKGATVKVSSSIVGKTLPIIADKVSDPNNGGTITIQTTSSFAGSGSNSFVMLVSQNHATENGYGTLAINLTQSGDGDLLLYAPHGAITMNQSSNNLGEVTAYLLTFNNNTEVHYSTGLAHLLFTSGPSGGYVLSDWREVVN